MKLKDLNYKNVSVGCVNGTNWLYIGKNDFDKINAEFEKYRECAILAQEAREKRIARLFEKLQELKDRGAELYEQEAVQNEINRVILQEEEIAQYLENFKPLEEREVVETYPRRTEKNMYNVLVEGSERGAYWTLNEYRMAQKKKAG